MQRYFCPVCFTEIAASERVCAACGTHIDRWEHQHTYFERCLRALRHPNPDVRMTAIITLSEVGDDQAAAALARCALDHPLDIDQGLAVVQGLCKLSPGQPRHEALEALAIGHPIATVRAAAAAALAPPPEHEEGEGG